MVALAASLLGGVAPAHAQGTTPRPTGVGDQLWADGFGAPNIPSNVRAVAVAPNGDVYVGGDFEDAGGDPTADHVARWDGTAWHGLGPGLSNTVRAIVVLPNGDVVVGGDFSAIGTATNTRALARWNGTSWSGFGSGIGTVYALALAPNGDLVAGGSFQNAGGNADADRVAKWNGSAWQALGPGITYAVSTVYAVAVLPNGDVVAGGDFQDAGGNAAADRLARWDGTAWRAYAGGPTGNVLALAALPNGQLAVGGNFVNVGGNASADYLARWDGSAWQAYGAGLSAAVASLAVLPTGQLAAGGDFINAGGDANADFVARWDGTAWQAYGTAAGVRVLALAVDASGRVLAGGQRNGADDGRSDHLRRWSGTAWEALADRRQHGLGFTVRAVATAVNGDLLVGGDFVNVEGDLAISHIARWNGQRWVALGPGLSGRVNCIVVAPSGDILVGGEFANAGGNPNADFVARWDGTAWQAIGTGYSRFTNALAIAANGDLYAAGETSDDYGYVSVFNGTSWRTVTASLSGPTLTAGGPVRSLVAAPGGGVYVGGGFLSAGAANTRYLARYNGTAWSSVGTLADAGQRDVGVFAMAAAPNGDLLVAGNFGDAGGIPAADNLARYTGGSWQAVGPYLSTLRAVAVAANGDVYAGGDFTGTTAQPTRNNVARWDGAAWQSLGTGLDAQVGALAVAPGGNVLVGGYFGNVGDKSKTSAYFALYRPTAPLATARATEPRPAVYPNPARRILHVALPVPGLPTRVTVTDAQGRIRSVPCQQGIVDVSGLAPGLYMISIAEGARTYHERFVKE